MKTTDDFLKQEVDRFHDVRPIILKDITDRSKEESKPVIEEHHKESKGIFGLIKSPEKDKKKIESSIEKDNVDKTKPVLSDEVIIIMETTDYFLKQEVGRFHDVRPNILKDITDRRKEESKPVVEKHHKESKGIFGLFKSPEKDKKKKESSIEKENADKTKPVLTDEVILNMKTSDSFLKQEVDKYHDARPIIQKNITDKRDEESESVEEQHKKESKDIFGLFKSPEKDKTKKESSIEKDHVDKTKPVLTQEVIVNMKTADSFLKMEVDQYHDVRPIISKNISVKNNEESSPAEEKHHKKFKGIFGLFKLPEKDRKKKESSMEKDVLDKTKQVFSDEVIVYMKTTDDFLKKEVDKYHDVRPIISKNTSDESNKESKSLEEKHRKESKGIFGLFKSVEKDKKKKESSIERDAVDKIKLVLSNEVIVNIRTTDDFLNQEVDKYHDVRPIILKNITDRSNEESKPVDQKHHKESKGVFGLFKSPEKDKEKKDVDKTKPLLSDEVIVDMKATDDFLKQEVDRFHDVRPNTSKDITDKTNEESAPIEESNINNMKQNEKLINVSRKSLDRVSSSDKEQLVIISNQPVADNFVRTEKDLHRVVRPAKERSPVESKTSTQDAYVVKSPVNERDTLKKLQDRKEKKGIFGIFKKKRKSRDEKDSKEFSSDVMRDMIQSQEFLSTEIEKYHDVRPTYLLYDEGTQISKNKIVSLKNETQSDGSQIKSSKKNGYETSNISEIALIDMMTTNTFLREEISKYDDVKLQSREQNKKPEETKGKPPKGNKFLGFFTKRSSQERDNSSLSNRHEKTKTEEISAGKKDERNHDNFITRISETQTVVTPPVNRIDDSKNFLQGEIDRYHDVRPVVLDGKNGDLFEKNLKMIEPCGQTPKGSGTCDVRTEKCESSESRGFEKTEERESIKEKHLKGEKISTITQEHNEHGDKVVTVTKEIYVINPNAIHDIKNLDEDIKRKLLQARLETDTLERDTSKPFVRETFSVETKIIDRIIPLSSDSNIDTEPKIIHESLTNVTTEDSKTDEFDSRPVLKETVVFLTQEEETYYDAKSSVTDLESDIPEVPDRKSRSSHSENISLQGVLAQANEKAYSETFMNESKMEKQSLHKEDDDNENLTKTDSKKEKEEKEKKGKSRDFFYRLAKTSDECSKAEIKDRSIPFTDEIIKTLQDTSTFLSNEVQSYEDAKSVLTTDLDDDTEGEEHTKSGLFSIFSKKKESPKVAKKIFKKHKKEKSHDQNEECNEIYKKIDSSEAINDESQTKTLEETTEISKTLIRSTDNKSKVSRDREEASKHKNEKSYQDSQTHIKLEDEENIVHRKDKGFFKKLGKLGSRFVGRGEQSKEKISTDIKEQSAEVVDTIVYEAQSQVEEIRNKSTDGSFAKQSSSGFADDMLESFDSTLQEMKKEQALEQSNISEDIVNRLPSITSITERNIKKPRLREEINSVKNKAGIESKVPLESVTKKSEFVKETLSEPSNESKIVMADVLTESKNLSADVKSYIDQTFIKTESKPFEIEIEKLVSESKESNVVTAEISAKTDKETEKKGGGLFSKLSEKLTGKTKEVGTYSEKLVDEYPCPEEKDPNTFSVIESQYDHTIYTRPSLGAIQQRTAEFLDSEMIHNSLSSLPRAVSDYGGDKKKIKSDRGSISEANIDLSNLPLHIDEQNTEKSSTYITSPVLPRRVFSQKYFKDERPDVVEITNISEYNIGNVTKYIVTEPDEDSCQENKKSAMFRIESEDDDLLDVAETESFDKSDSVRSNIHETLTENAVDSLLTNLSKDMEKAMSFSIFDQFEKEVKLGEETESKLKEHVEESKVEVEIIEKKLRDLDKALGFLEQAEHTEEDSKSEKKLKRVERKFERMASKLLEEDEKEARDLQLSTPDREEKRETEFQKLVSQISTEEVSDFQKDYSHLWDENTFSKSDDWESKTPDSQVDVQELPKGDQAEGSSVLPGSSSTQAEFEEVQDKKGKDKAKRVADQHQLSDEMKELLEEMEKESKE